jgi:L-2,4-diaminobutyrate decarboxylase
LREIGEFCRARGIWFHVDGAHGASALLSARYRRLLDGIDLADSAIWDAHKLMRTPPLCAAVLVRDHHDLDRAFEQEASYLFHDKAQPGVDFIHRTVECTKSGLGLKLFFVVAALGENGLAAYIERQCDLAAEAYEYLVSQPDIECPVSPQSNIVCFRLRGSDQDQLAHRDRLIATGQFHLSTTLFKGRRYLRIVFMSPQTRMDDVKALVNALRRPQHPSHAMNP